MGVSVSDVKGGQVGEVEGGAEAEEGRLIPWSADLDPLPQGARALVLVLSMPRSAPSPHLLLAPDPLLSHHTRALVRVLPVPRSVPPSHLVLALFKAHATLVLVLSMPGLVPAPHPVSGTYDAHAGTPTPDCNHAAPHP